MSWTPSDAVREKDRERKRRAYVPKTERGEAARKVLDLIEENKRMRAVLSEILRIGGPYNLAARTLIRERLPEVKP